MLLIGCDFSSRPGPRKPIVMALGQAKAGVVSLDALQAIFTLEAFASSLRERRSWVGGFDLPFGLPRELVQTLGWPTQWLDCLRTYQALSRAQIRDLFAAFCNARPAGRKFAHRATDRWAGSSPSMKWVNPPVAYMLHAGVPLLVDAGVSIPGLFDGDSTDVDARILACWRVRFSAGTATKVMTAPSRPRSAPNAVPSSSMHWCRGKPAWACGCS